MLGISDIRNIAEQSNLEFSANKTVLEIINKKIYEAAIQGEKIIQLEVYDILWQYEFGHFFYIVKKTPIYDRVELHLAFMELERQGYEISDYDAERFSYVIRW